jgi:glycerol-3-phosphate acyltransferase PlsY
VTLAGLIAAYLIGAIPVGFVVSRVVGGTDIRRQGSGNIGATNVLRTLGPVPAILTLLGDVAKGFAAVVACRAVAPGPTAEALAPLLAVIGNCWPVYLGFRGGKGVATGLGAFLAVAPWAIPATAAVWGVVTAASRYVSLASVIASLCLAPAVLLTGYPTVSAAGAAAVAALVVWRHRENLHRLRTGTERRLGGSVRA